MQRLPGGTHAEARGVDEQDLVGWSDLSAAAGCRSDRLKQSAGVIYWSDEEFLAYFDAQPYEQPELQSPACRHTKGTERGRSPRSWAIPGVPTHEGDRAFSRDFRRLTPQQRSRFRATLSQFIADLQNIEANRQAQFRPGLVRKLTGTRGVFEMRWAPDGRAAYEGRTSQIQQRHALDIRAAELRAVISEMESLVGETDAVEPVSSEPVSEHRIEILEAAVKEAKKRVADGWAEVEEGINEAILDLARRFDIGRHPGLLLVDSIGAEETEPGDLAEFMRELVTVTDELGIETIVASARPEILTHVPEDRRVSATGDGYLW